MLFYQAFLVLVPDVLQFLDGFTVLLGLLQDEGKFLQVVLDADCAVAQGFVV